MAKIKAPAKKNRAIRKKAAPPARSVQSNKTDETGADKPDATLLGRSLHSFNLSDLRQYTIEKLYSTDASKSFHVFYTGRDDINAILKHILSRVTISLYINMGDLGNKELNQILFDKAMDRSVTMLTTLDKSQSAGIYERQLIGSDFAQNPTAYNTYFAISSSTSREGSHAKGFVADGIIAVECSPNWPAGDESVLINTNQSGDSGYKTSNTLSIILDPDMISHFTAELIAEHMAVQALASPGEKSEQRVPFGTSRKKVK